MGVWPSAREGAAPPGLFHNRAFRGRQGRAKLLLSRRGYDTAQQEREGPALSQLEAVRAAAGSNSEDRTANEETAPAERGPP